MHKNLKIGPLSNQAEQFHYLFIVNTFPNEREKQYILLWAKKNQKGFLCLSWIVKANLTWKQIHDFLYFKKLQFWSKLRYTSCLTAYITFHHHIGCHLNHESILIMNTFTNTKCFGKKRDYSKRTTKYWIGST